MATFGQMQSDMQLLGMANLLNADFGSLINKVQREEVESYPWSFLFQTVVIYGSIPFTQGTATIVKGNTSVTGTGTNFPIPALPPAPPSCFWLWIGPTLTTPVQVNTFNSAVLLTLTTPWLNVTQTNVSYVLQQLYYPITPLQTVFRVRQIDNLVETSQSELNEFDPSRIATGGTPSLRWANGPFVFNAPLSFSSASQTNIPTIELWPRTAQALPYILDGKIGPVDMVNASDLPMLPAQVLEAKAMMYACRALYASSGNPKWQTMADAYKVDYEVELEKAKWEDSKRVTPKGITSWGGRRLFDLSIDANHDLDGPPDFSTN